MRAELALSTSQKLGQRPLYLPITVRVTGAIEFLSALGGERLGQHLDGDFAIELGVGRAVDGVHAAFAQFGEDLAVGDLLRAPGCACLASYHFPA